MNVIGVTNEIIDYASLTRPALPYFISDGHHNMNELEKESIFLSFISNGYVSEYLLSTLDNLNLSCEKKL